MPSYSSVDQVCTQYFTFAEDEPFRMASGATLSPVKQAFQTYGKLNADRTNAVLVCHALSGSQQAAGTSADDPGELGWWYDCIGPGKAFDTEKLFVICSNVIGGCFGSSGPTTIHSETGRPYGLSFPVVTIADMVEAQVQLINHLGIEKLLCIAGGSMGGMQVLQWTSRYPERLHSAIPIATTARHSPLQIAFDAVGREAILRDPHWHDGDYYERPNHPDAGLAVARMIGHITYLSDSSMHSKFGRRLQDREKVGYDFRNTDFQVESYLQHNGNKFPARFDANSYLYVTKAMDYFDLSHETGRLADAFRHAEHVRFLIVSFTSDWLYPSYQSKELVKALSTLGINATYVDVKSVWGHDAFLLETNTMTELISNFLGRLSRELEVNPPSECPAKAA